MRGFVVFAAMAVMTGLSACHLVFGHDPTAASVSPAQEGGKDFRPSAEVRTLDAHGDAVSFDRARRDVKHDAGADRGRDTFLPADAFVKPDSELCLHPPVAKNCTGEWCQIPAGCFMMGSPNNEPCRDAPTETQAKVWLSHGLEFGRKEVTQDQFKAVMGGTYVPSNPWCYDSASKQVTTGCPVETITWHEAAAYCNALSDKAGLASCYTCSGTGHGTFCYPNKKPIVGCGGYRLPTSAEWEYAYRAGTTTSSYAGKIQNCAGNDPVAGKTGWYKALSGGVTREVATFNGNPQGHPWGLQDIAGNVAEWVHDVWPGGVSGTDPEGPAHPTVKPTATATPPMMFRGGSYKSEPADLRAARKQSDSSVAPPRMFADVGFRCVRSIIP